jgi:hypothetical protein
MYLFAIDETGFAEKDSKIGVLLTNLCLQTCCHRVE